MKEEKVFANSKNGGGSLITKKNKKAFTLIELLAIIVILAIIAVITVPIILNIIENSKKGAASDSAYGYKDAVNKAYIQELAKPNNENLKLDGTYVVQSNGSLNADTGYSFGVSNYTNLPVSVSGDKPSSGTLTYSNNVLTSGCLVIGDYAVTFDGNETSTVKGDCSSSNQQGGNQQTTNPYLTRFDGNYIGYWWTDESNEEYAPLTIDPTIQDIMNPGEDEYDPCEYGYTYNNGKCYNYSCQDGFNFDSESYKCVNEYYWHDSLNPDSKIYTRTTGSLAEVCGVFGTGNAGTVCMTSVYFNSDYTTADYYHNDFYDCVGDSSYDGKGETCLKGYAKAKADEMLSKGATSCSVNGGSRVSCFIPKEEPDDFQEEFIIRGVIEGDGNVEFFDGEDNYVSVSRNGDYNW